MSITREDHLADLDDEPLERGVGLANFDEEELPGSAGGNVVDVGGRIIDVGGYCVERDTPVSMSATPQAFDTVGKDRDVVDKVAARIRDREAAAAFIEVDERPRVIKALDIEVEKGVTWGDKIKPLERFFKERAVSQVEAVRVLREICPSLGDDLDIDYKKFLERVDVRTFCMTGKTGRFGAIEDDAFIGRLTEAIAQKWSEMRRVFTYFNMKFPGGIDPSMLAALLPRAIHLRSEQKDLGLNMEQTPENAVRLQAMFCLFSMNILKRVSGFKQAHRQAYMLAMIAMHLGAACGRESALFNLHERKVATPSLGLIPKFRDIAEAKKFIDARLSLLMSKDFLGTGHRKDLIDHGSGEMEMVVQEDWITDDLRALTEELGLGEEYAPIFEGMAYFRQLQLFNDSHLPENDGADASNEGQRNRWSLRRVIDEFKSREGKTPTIADFGCGNVLLPKRLVKEGLAENITCVDKVKGETYREEFCDGKIKVTRVKDLVSDDKTESPEWAARELRANVMANLGKADVVIAADSLHESGDARQYLIDLYDHTLNEGGFLYGIDPTHCKAADSLTAEANKHDSVLDPETMPSLEDYMDAIAYIKAKGGEVVAINIIPGIRAGYRDVFYRLSFVIRKPKKDEDKPFQIKGIESEYDIPFELPEDIFKLWPLSLISDAEQRKDLLGVVGKVPRDTKLRDARSFVIARLLKVPEIVGEADGAVVKTQSGIVTTVTNLINMVSEKGYAEAAKEHITKEKLEPYPELDLLLATLNKRDDEELKTRNSVAGKAKAIVRLLKKRMGIDLSPAMRNDEYNKGWQFAL